MAKINYNAKTAKDSNTICRKIAEHRKRMHLTQGEFIKRLVTYGVEVQQGAIKEVLKTPQGCGVLRTSRFLLTAVAERRKK